MLVCTIGITTNSFPVFLPYIIEDGGLSKTQGSALSTVRCLFSFLSVLTFEKFYKTVGMRRGLTLLTLNVALSTMIYSVADSFPVFCLAAAISGISHGLGGLVATSVLMNRWFRDRIGLALGICSGGAGLGIVFISPLTTFFVEKFSLGAAYKAAAVFSALSALIVYGVIRNEPSDKKLSAYTGTQRRVENKRSPAPQTLYRMEEKTKWLMFIAAFLTGVTAFGGMPHIPVLLRERGFDSVTASLSMSLFGIAMTLGKFTYGALADRIGTYKTCYAFSALNILGMTLITLCTGGQTAFMSLCIVAFGMGMAQSTVAFSLWARDLTEGEGYPRFVKNIQAFYMAGGTMCGALPGLIADISGRYVPAFLLMSVLALLTLILTQYSYKKSELRR